MDFLRRFATFWRGCIRQQNSVNGPQTTESIPDPYADGPVSDSERLSRFIFDDSAFTASTGRINFREFLPPKKGKHKDEFSVMRTEKLADPAVWTLGDETLAERDGRSIRARGDFDASVVRSSRAGDWRLDVQPSVPPPRHAHILGWPPVSEVDARKSRAAIAARRATCRPLTALPVSCEALGCLLHLATLSPEGGLPSARLCNR